MTLPKSYQCNLSHYNNVKEVSELYFLLHYNSLLAEIRTLTNTETAVIVLSR